MTTIEWAHAGLGRGETWNPIRARNKATGTIGWHCEKVSPACEHCYAERQNVIGARGGTALPYKPGHRQNGDIELFLDETTLLAPLRWKTARGIFVCSMTDAFGDWVSDEWLDQKFAVAALCPQHIFIWLTKRPMRMREYFGTYGRLARVLEARVGLPNFDHALPKNWPLPNVWLGVTAEDQRRAEARIPDLLATPAAVRFVSIEPMLGAIDLTAIDINGDAEINALAPPTDKQNWDEQWAPETTGTTLEDAIEGFEDFGFSYPPSDKPNPRLDWVICGGESGPSARPTHPDWARSLRDQCAAAGVPFFFKQWGEFSPHAIEHGGSIVPPMPVFGSVRNFYRWRATEHSFQLTAAKIARRPLAPGLITLRVGKARAGRLLDGVEHNEFPGV